MLFDVLCLLAIGSTALSAEITASDLPQCAIDCYCDASEKVNISITAYKEQCLSAPFQLAIRECARKTCTEEEYEFVRTDVSGAYCRRNIKRLNIVKVMAWTFFKLLQPTTQTRPEALR